MKKLLFLFMSMAVLVACSDDDDDNGSADRIEGTWSLAGASNVPGYTYNECSSQSTITFMADNTATSEFYSDSSGTCESSNDQGNWTNDGGGIYTIDIPGFDTPVAGMVTFSGDSEFTFIPSLMPNASLTFEKS